MSEYADEFVHEASVGDAGACVAFVESARGVLSALDEEGKVASYYALVIHSPAEAAEDFVPVSDVDAITAGRYPYVFLRVQAAGDQGAAGLVEPLGCVEVRGSRAHG